MQVAIIRAFLLKKSSKGSEGSSIDRSIVERYENFSSVELDSWGRGRGLVPTCVMKSVRLSHTPGCSKKSTILADIEGSSSSSILLSR